MCKAMSCIVLKNKKVIWKFGMDSHDDLLRVADIPDNSRDPVTVKFCRVEISPKNKDYLNPDAKYLFKMDMDFTPAWWTEDHEKAAWKAFQKWKKQLDAVLVQKPIIHPFKIDIPEITNEHVRLLREWDPVRASVGDLVWDSIWDSIWDPVWASVGDLVGDSVADSVWDSIWDLVGDSVWASVRTSVADSVWAYTGTFFTLPRKYADDINTGEYPFQCLADLWNQGLVPSFDGTTWRLHAGLDAKIVFSITKEELMRK